MPTSSFLESERICSDVFNSLGPTFHCFTSENHPVIFENENDYKAGMCILAVCVLLHPGLRVYTFQLMSNHIHLAISGDPDEIDELFRYFKERIRKYLEGIDRYDSLCDFKLKQVQINDLDNLRNVIAYINRNGFVANQNCSPFSYPWGANTFYYQPTLRKFTSRLGVPIKTSTLRSILHSKKCDSVKTLSHIDGIVSATSFCDIETGESLFRNARHYFYCVSRNVESYAQISKTIGESIFYTDEDLYMICRQLSEKQYNISDPKQLNSESKIKLALELHREYNAGDKQIQRILKIPSSVLASLF